MIRRSLRQRNSVSYTDFFAKSMDDSPIISKKGNKRELHAVQQIKQEVNEYELMRQKNIKEKMEMLKQLNIPFLVQNIEVSSKEKESHKKPRVSDVKRSPESKVSPLPVRRSSRIAKHSDISFKENISFTETSEKEEEEELKPFGLQSMKSLTSLSNDDPEVIEKLGIELKELSNLPCVDTLISSAAEFKTTLKKLSLQEKMVRKVGNKRSLTLAVHPSESSPLVIVGDVTGTLGLWNIMKDDDESVQNFKPHRGAIYCVSVCAYNPLLVYSTSFDGMVRCCDLETQMFSDVYLSDQSKKDNHTVHHDQFSRNVLMVAHGTGSVGFIDCRISKATQFYKCHEASVRTVQLHPTNEHLFTTSSRMKEVCIWDARKTKGAPVSRIPHPKALKSAFFSPNGLFLLTNCNDDKIRLYNGHDILKGSTPEVIMQANHNNYTGQWISPFKAKWHPRRDDTFIIGSLDKSRKIDIYNCDGFLFELTSPNLSTVVSCCEFHPTLPLVVGANNSGKVHAFMAK